MAIITVKNLPEEVHRALQARAELHGRSTKAEICELLEATVRPTAKIRIGTALAELSRRAGLTNEDVAVMEQARDESSAEPMKFE